MVPGVPGGRSMTVINLVGVEYRSETGLVTIPLHLMVDCRVWVIPCRQPPAILNNAQVHFILSIRSVLYTIVERLL